MIKLHWTAGDGGAYGKVVRNMIRETNQHAVEDADAVIHMGHPVRLNNYKGKKKIWFAAEDFDQIDISRAGAILLVPDYTIAISEFSKRAIAQHTDKVDAVHMGVDTDLYKPMKEMRGKTFRFITTATEECYGKTYMEESWIMASNKMDRVELLIKDHSEKGLTEVEMDEIEARLPCSLVSRPSGWKLTQNELTKLYNTADCLFYPVPSIASSLTVLECMACEVPAIVPNYAALPEIVDGNTGYLAPVEIIDADRAGNYLKQPKRAHMLIKDLRSGIVHAYNNRAEVIEKGKKARKKVVENFTWKHVADKFMKIIERVV